MKTLSLEALDTVTGGTPTLQTGSTTGSSGSSGSSDQVMQTLQSIQSSIKDLSNNHNQGLFGGPTGPLLMMTMALAFSRRSEVVVYGGGHRGWSWRAGW